MHRQSVEPSGTPVRSVAAEEAHGPADEQVAFLGHADAGPGIVQQAADLAQVEALARMSEANGFKVGELLQGIGRGRAADDLHRHVVGTAARGAGARGAGRGRARQYLFRRRMGR